MWNCYLMTWIISNVFPKIPPVSKRATHFAICSGRTFTPGSQSSHGSVLGDWLHSSWESSTKEMMERGRRTFILGLGPAIIGLPYSPLILLFSEVSLQILWSACCYGEKFVLCAWSINAWIVHPLSFLTWFSVSSQRFRISGEIETERLPKPIDVNDRVGFGSELKLNWTWPWVDEK